MPLATQTEVENEILRFFIIPNVLRKIFIEKEVMMCMKICKMLCGRTDFLIDKQIQRKMQTDFKIVAHARFSLCFTVCGKYKYMMRSIQWLTRSFGLGS